MYKLDGLKHHVDIHGQNLAKAQTLPQNTSANGNGGAVFLGGILGAVEILARVHAAVTIADTKAITIKVQHSDSEDSGFADLATVYTLTAADGSGALAKDTELGRFALPSSVKDYVKAVITTTDAAAAGKVDVIPVYLPR